MTEPLFSSHEAESYKKKVSLKEDINLSTMELSGTVIKQGYLAKQVRLAALEQDGQFSTSGETGISQRVGGLSLPEALIISRMS